PPAWAGATRRWTRSRAGPSHARERHGARRRPQIQRMAWRARSRHSKTAQPSTEAARELTAPRADRGIRAPGGDDQRRAARGPRQVRDVLRTDVWARVPLAARVRRTARG